MTRKRLMMIVTGILVLGGLMMLFNMNGDKQLSKEEQRNREYEVSLVRALKNSYRDIEEIRISNPSYSEKPGSWSCSVELSFTDREKIKSIMPRKRLVMIITGILVLGGIFMFFNLSDQ